MKLCAKCLHFHKAGVYGRHPICIVGATITHNFVDGTKIYKNCDYVWNARSEKGHCGPEGNLFVRFYWWEFWKWIWVADYELDHGPRPSLPNGPGPSNLAINLEPKVKK